MIEAIFVDHLGTDLTVVNAARRSHGVKHEVFTWEAKTLRSRSDVDLIGDLVAGGHFLPFRHPHIELSCAAPLPIARQLGKHQVGMTWSEISRRYKKKDLTFHYLDNTWRAEPADVRQGEGSLLPNQSFLNHVQHRNIAACLEDFSDALDAGACLEQARFLLPQSMDVLWTWTGSLLAWYHVYHMRNHPDVQKECRDFASLLPRLIGSIYPVSWGFLTHTYTPPQA